MKERIIILCTALSMISFEGAKAQKAKPSAKILVAYYSWSGNTRAMAEQIQRATGADIFEIEPQTVYPSDYQALVNQAKGEIERGVKPALKAMPENLSQYDIIFVGTPNWWSTIAPPVATFLTNGNFAGKTVVPFATHGGGGMARCEADVKKLCPKATLLKGLAVSGSSAKDVTPHIGKWLKEIGIIK